MAMIDEFKELFGEWIAAVANAVDTIAGRFVRSRRILLEEGEDGALTAKASPAKNGPALPDVSFRLDSGRPNPPLGGRLDCGLSRQPRRGATATRALHGKSSSTFRVRPAISLTA